MHTEDDTDITAGDGKAQTGGAVTPAETITTWCAVEDLSKSAFYELDRRGLAPYGYAVPDSKIRRITESHQSWRARMAEAAAVKVRLSKARARARSPKPPVTHHSAGGAAAVGKRNIAYARMDDDFYPTPEWCITALADTSTSPANGFGSVLSARPYCRSPEARRRRQCIWDRHRRPRLPDYSEARLPVRDGDAAGYRRDRHQSAGRRRQQDCGGVHRDRPAADVWRRAAGAVAAN